LDLDPTEIVEERVEKAKARVNFERAILYVIGFITTNFFITGLDPPVGMLSVFAICIVAYVLIFAIDLVVPLIDRYLKIWSAEKPPMWVQVALDIAENQMKLVSSLPLALCSRARYEDEPPPL
jgi:hypothetical protein